MDRVLFFFWGLFDCFYFVLLQNIASEQLRTFPKWLICFRFLMFVDIFLVYRRTPLPGGDCCQTSRFDISGTTLEKKGISIVTAGSISQTIRISETFLPHLKCKAAAASLNTHWHFQLCVIVSYWVGFCKIVATVKMLQGNFKC